MSWKSRSGLYRCACQWRRAAPLFNHTPTLSACEKIVSESCAVRHGCWCDTDSDDYTIMSEAAWRRWIGSLTKDWAASFRFAFMKVYLNPVRKGVHNEYQLRQPNWRTFVAHYWMSVAAGKTEVTGAGTGTSLRMVSVWKSHCFVLGICGNYEQAMAV